MSSDMLSTQEWAQLKSWLIQAQLKATTTQWSAESWLWHWATDDVSFVPIIEMAEQWDGTSNWDATLVHWVESVDIGSGFDAANPPLALAMDNLRLPLAVVWTQLRLQRLRPQLSRHLALAHALVRSTHFPNGRRRLGLTPQVLVECQSWIREARDCHNRLGFTSGDWLVYWFCKDIREEVRRLMHSAYEANQGWSAASWLKLWLEEADVPGPPPGQPPSGTASASASAEPSGQGAPAMASATPGSGSGTALVLALALSLAVCLWLHAHCHRLSPRFWLRPIIRQERRVR